MSTIINNRKADPALTTRLAHPMQRRRYRIRTLMTAVAGAAVVIALLTSWLKQDVVEKAVSLIVLVPGAIIIGAMVAIWINWRAPH